MGDPLLYLWPFLTAMILTVVLILAFLKIPFFQLPVFRRRSRQLPIRRLSRLGGVAMLLAFTLTFFWEPHLVLNREFMGLFFGLGAIFLFGLWDDIAELDWKTQVFFQVALGILVYLFGVRILSLTNPFGGAWIFPTEGFSVVAFLLLLVWLIVVINSMNWLDGLDGLCGGVAFITFVTIFFLSLKPEVNQPPLAIIAAIGAGTVLGFLLFNFSPAKILAGTVGSVFLGFVLAILAVVAGTKIATALLVLSLPIVDSFYVLIRRYRAGAFLFQPDERHLHYRLRELGWSQGRIAWFFILTTALIAAVALATQALSKLLALFLVLLITLSLLGFVEHQVKKKEKVASYGHNR